MSTETQRTFPKITDNGLDELRQRIGVKIGQTAEPWCYEATRDNIRHYAHGIGDDNPLWCDPDYAAKSHYGGIVALPSFLFSTSRIVSGYVGGLPGVHAMWSGADWTWHKEVRRNDVISTEAYLKDLVEHQTRFAGRAIQQIYHVDFFNQSGDKVAEADSWCFRTERDHARENGTKYREVRERGVRRYTDEELGEAYKLYRDEEVRGAVPRYWEDVNVGDELTSGTASSLAPGVKPVAEQGHPGFEFVAWNALYAPRGTSAEITRTLNAAVNKVLAKPDVRQRLLDLGFEPAGGSSAYLGVFATKERERWAPIIKAAGIRADQ